MNWSLEAPITDWDGVTVNGTTGRVEALRLISWGLTGQIPPVLSTLVELRQLDLRDNRLTGSIPPEIGGLANLQELLLHVNHLSGPIPLKSATSPSFKYWPYTETL